ncbi:hypothetical protein H311_03190, partial [Anncaliia algerae PRA109]
VEIDEKSFLRENSTEDTVLNESESLVWYRERQKYFYFQLKNEMGNFYYCF